MPKLAESRICQIAGLPRDEIIEQLIHFPGTFPFDFTREYLDALSDEHLRHMLMAAYLHAHKDET